MKRLKVGVVGANYMSSRVHLPALSAMTDKLELVAIADLNEASGRAAADNFGVRYYKTHLDMMENEQLDIVDINTSPLMHHVIIHDAAKRGIHINCEKPATMTMAMMDFIIKTVEEKGVHFQVSENYPHMPWDMVIRKMRDLGLFGDLVSASLCTPVNTVSFDIGVHHYAQIRDFVGCAPKNLVAAVKVSKHFDGGSLEVLDDRVRGFGDIVGAAGGATIEFENGVDARMDFIPFHFGGDNKDYYLAGDLRRLVGTKLMVTDNIWPMILPNRGQKPEFHVYQLNEDKTFRELPVDIVWDSIGGEKYIRKITVPTDPVVEWEVPSWAIAPDSSIVTEPDGIFNFDATIAWRTAMVELYDRLYNKIVSGEAPVIDPVDREGVEFCVAMMHSEAMGRTRVDLPLTETTEYEKNYTEFYQKKMGEGVFDFINSEDESVKSIEALYDKQMRKDQAAKND